MAIIVNVQYKGGFLPDMKTLTLCCYHHRGTRLNAMKGFCLGSLCSHPNVLTIFPPVWGCSEGLNGLDFSFKQQRQGGLSRVHQYLSPPPYHPYCHWSYPRVYYRCGRAGHSYTEYGATFTPASDQPAFLCAHFSYCSDFLAPSVPYMQDGPPPLTFRSLHHLSRQMQMPSPPPSSSQFLANTLPTVLVWSVGAILGV